MVACLIALNKINRAPQIIPQRTEFLHRNTRPEVTIALKREAIRSGVMLCIIYMAATQIKSALDPSSMRFKHRASCEPSRQPKPLRLKQYPSRLPQRKHFVATPKDGWNIFPVLMGGGANARTSSVEATSM